MYQLKPKLEKFVPLSANPKTEKIKKKERTTYFGQMTTVESNWSWSGRDK